MSELVVIPSPPNTVVVTRTPTVLRTLPVTETVEVAAPGPQGPKGADGTGVLPPVPFAFGDASPAVVLTLAADAVVTAVGLEITTPFDGAGASLALGTLAQPGLLMSATQNDPALPVVFETDPWAELPAGTQVVLAITPGAGATQGAGQFAVTVVYT